MRSIRIAVALLASVALLGACGSDDEPADEATGSTTGGTAPASTQLTIYSGRSEELVGPLVEMFEERSGIEVEVRYGDTAEMAALILEEGDASPADVYYGQDAGALGALSAEGALAPLDEEILDTVPEAMRSTRGDWVGTSGRARTVVYNTDALTEEDLPDTIAGYADPEWSGRLGWAPTNGSFQAFVTSMRVLEGDDATREWLQAMVDNDITAYDNNTAIVEAVAAGEIDAGFVNHYYALRMKAEDPSLAAANHYIGGGDPGGLVNVAGVGIVEGTDAEEAAEQFVRFLLSEEAQTYFATETFEIPLVEGVPAPEGAPDFVDLTVPEIDLGKLDDLDGTLALLQETGVV